MNNPCQITVMSEFTHRKIKRIPCILSRSPVTYGSKSMTLLAMAVWAALSSTAHADCTSVSGIYLCENTLTSPVLITENGDISVMTEDGFSIIASDPVSAMSIRGSGHISYLDNYASSLSNVSGMGKALSIVNAVSGPYQDASVTVKTDGRLTGGIFIDNKSNGGAATLTLDATGIIDVTQGDGIYSYNSAREGDASQILSAGTITAGSYGIISQNHTNEGDASQILSAGTITAGSYGIVSQNYTNEGDASQILSVSTITTANRGIESENYTNEGDASQILSAGTITAEYTGIISYNSTYEGDSSQTITAEAITAGSNGIENYNSAREGNATLTISAGTIAAEYDGIFSRNYVREGDASLTISAGTITAAQDSGMYIVNNVGNGRSDTTVRAGQITSLSDAIHVYDYITGNLSDASTISVTTLGDIRSQQGIGIFVETTDADSYITVAGLVSGGNGTAIDVQRLNDLERSTTLALHAGYDLVGVTQTTTVDISGNAQLDVLNSHLVLGGGGNADFDLSRIDNSVNALTTGEANRITGFGTLVKSGDSVWTLTGANSADTADGFLYARVDAGTLALDNATLILAGANRVPGATGILTIAPAGTLGGYGQVSGDVTNQGTLILGQALTGRGYGTFIIDGNYTGSHGGVIFGTELGADSALTDKLVVTGSTSGDSTVTVLNIGGAGAQTENGIKLIEVGGHSGGQFTLNGRAVAGAYDYFLYQGGVSTPDDGDWYLRSSLSPVNPEVPGDDNPDEPIYRPEGSGYMANMAAAGTLFNLRLEDREGRAENSSLWLRQVGARTKHRDSSGQMRTATNRYVVQGGGEVFGVQTAETGRLGLGLMAAYGQADSKSHSVKTGYRADSSVEGYSVGGYATWYQDAATLNGMYVDSWVQYSWLDAEVKGKQLAKERYDMDGLSASLEAGYRLPVYQGQNGEVFITPQGQVIWNGMTADEHREANGTTVRGSGHDNVQTRLGVKVSRDGVSNKDKGTDKLFTVYGEANWIYNSQQAGAVLDGVAVKQSGNRHVGELKLGAEGQLNRSWGLWSNVTQQLGDKGYSDTSVMLGVKYPF